MKKIPSLYKLPIAVFILSTTVLITFQATFLYANNLWQSKVSDMIRTDKTQLSENITALDAIVKSKSVYTSETSSLNDGTMTGYLSGLGDRYAMYLNPSQYADYLAQTAQSTSVGVGINALFDSANPGIYVVNVYSGSPAEKSGIIPGDTITHVNGEAVTSGSFYGAMLKLGSGEAGTGVVLKIKHLDGTSHDLTVSRGIVSVNSSVTSQLVENVGIIKISEFSSSATDDFKKELEKLLIKGADRFVIDIRNNPGGDIKDIAAILDFILPEGVSITSTDRDGSVKQYKSDLNGLTYPITLTVNHNTVCGAEVFASAMREFDVAELVGETTYGKATTQQLFVLNDGSAVTFSTVFYTTPSGNTFDGTGLSPDYAVPLDYVELGHTNIIPYELDTQLQKAVEIVKEKISEYENG